VWDLSEAILLENHASVFKRQFQARCPAKFTVSRFAGVLILRHCAEAFREIHQTLALLPMPLKTNAVSFFKKNVLQQAALVSLVVAHWVKSTRAEMHESHIPFVLIRGWDGSAMIPPLTSIKPAAEPTWS
jgi:hypothetical protein